MNEPQPLPSPAPLDELATQLLECGAVLSQVVAGAAGFAAEGQLTPVVPIPAGAHEVVASVLDRVRRRYSKRDIRVAAAIVGEAAEAISEEVFIVDPGLLEALDGEEIAFAEEGVVPPVPSLQRPARRLPAEHVTCFVRQLLAVGVTLANVTSGLIDDLPPDAYPGEDPAEVVLEMITGTIESEIGAEEPEQVRQATSLIARSADRVVEHLRLALALRRRLAGESGGTCGFG
jgi:hypothetical protein